ncbi:hypothetical protein CSUI_006247, partial [Cystoisospora suis]
YGFRSRHPGKHRLLCCDPTWIEAKPTKGDCQKQQCARSGGNRAKWRTVRADIRRLGRR